MELTNKDIEILTNELISALIRCSENKLSKENATKIAKETIKNIDFSNEAFAHKGMNWLAKEILKKIKY